MKRDIEHLFLANIVQVTLTTVANRKITHYTTLVDRRVVYQIDSTHFIDIANHKKYTSNIDTARIDDQIIEAESLIPVRPVLEKLKITRATDKKVSPKVLVKLLANHTI